LTAPAGGRAMSFYARCFEAEVEMMLFPQTACDAPNGADDLIMHCA
jgi:uncharacterized glyoxalase superfamily protein PhnB